MQAQDESPMSLIGTWQLVKNCAGNDTGAVEWVCVPVEDGTIITFREDLTFIFVYPNGSKVSGTYTLKITPDKRTYEPKDIRLLSTTITSTPGGKTIEEVVSWKEGLLALSPYDGSCPGGCAGYFKKTTEK